MSALMASDFSRLQDAMLAEKQVEIPVRHYFCNGVYVREIFIPKGTVAMGKIHKTDHINIISMGDVTIISPKGKFRVQAPYTSVVGPGQCVAYAWEDTIWSTILSTPETDPEKIETIFIAKDYGELMTYLEKT